MRYGTQCLIYKFNITKVYFEKIFKNCSTQNFHKFIYNEILYPILLNFYQHFFIIERGLEKQLSVKCQENIQFS